MINFENFAIENAKDWKKIHHDIFGTTIPFHYEWTDTHDIVTVLDKIASVENSNHMFFPESGGLDLEGVSISYEKGAIELLASMPYIVKPRKLTFESIDDDLDWNYFRLEAKELIPSGVCKDLPKNALREEVLELSPGHYIDKQYWDKEKYDGRPLPSTARIVRRYFIGTFVIFKKTSAYNNNPTTYDARHHKLSEEEFRKLIIGANTYKISRN